MTSKILNVNGFIEERNKFHKESPVRFVQETTWGVLLIGSWTVVSGIGKTGFWSTGVFILLRRSHREDGVEIWWGGSQGTNPSSDQSLNDTKSEVRHVDSNSNTETFVESVVTNRGRGPRVLWTQSRDSGRHIRPGLRPKKCRNERNGGQT